MKHSTAASIVDVETLLSFRSNSIPTLFALANGFDMRSKVENIVRGSTLSREKSSLSRSLPATSEVFYFFSREQKSEISRLHSLFPCSTSEFDNAFLFFCSMEQPPAAAQTQARAAAASIPQQQEQQQEQLAWASPPRPPFAGEDIDNSDAAAADVSTSTATTSTSAESSLAARYFRKLVELRALVADAHFRGKDLAGKGKGEMRGTEKAGKH